MSDEDSPWAPSMVRHGRPDVRAGRVRLPRVGALGIQLDPDEPELLGGGRFGVRRDIGRDPWLPADRVADLLQRSPRVERVEAHLAGVVEVVDAEVGDDDGRAAAQPALLAADPRRVLRPAEVARGGPEVDPLDEQLRRLWRMITKTWRALIAISHAPPEPGRRVVGWS